MLAACKPLILLGFHKSFNDTPTKQGPSDQPRKAVERKFHGFLYAENHSLGEWFKRRLVPIMETKKLPLLK